MSRIHEALKKAAQERAAQLARSPKQEILETAVEIKHPILSVTDSIQTLERPKQDSPVVSSPARPTDYQELLKRCAQYKWEPDARLSVFTRANAGDPGAERFRTLRSRLYQIAATRPLRRLLITSSVAAEGKTFVTSNLGQSIAQQMERRVLLIDADLRAPRLHFTLGAARYPGLSDYLKGKIDEYTAIQRGALDNLFLIPAGAEVSDPSELLSSGGMKRLLDVVTPVFDWIIIDTPPAMPVHDASILADLADGVLLVLRAGSTEAEIADKAADEFRDKNLLGVVLNRVRKSDSYGSYYYSYGGEDRDK